MPQAAQRPGQPAGPLGDLGERTAAGAVRRRGHDLGVGVHARRVLEEAGDAQRGVLHGALHVTSVSPGSLAGGWRLVTGSRDRRWRAFLDQRTQCARVRTPSRRPGRARRRHPVPHPQRVGGGAGADALPAPGRGADRAAGRQQRGAGDADGVGEVAGRDRCAPGGAGRRPGVVLHRADQGAGEREVLRAVRGVRRRRRRHADRRRQRQRRRADHRLHRRGARQHRPARGRPRRRRAGGDGRVPLLRRARPRLGVAGAAAGAAGRAVRADVRHPGRRLGDRRGPDPAYRPVDRRGRRGRAARPPQLPVVRRTSRRDGRGARHDRPGAGVRRALHAGQRRRARDPAAGRRGSRQARPASTRTPSPRRSGPSGSAPASARRCRSW